MATRLSDMRTASLENANSLPNRRGPPLGRLWPRVTACGSALTPQLLGINSCADQDLVIADSVVRSRMELVQDVSHDNERIAYFCIYMADQPTWLERDSGRIYEIAPYDIAIINSKMPLRTVSTTGTRHLSLFLPHSMMLARLPWADEICGRSFSLDSRTRGTAHSLIAALRASIELDHFDAVGPCLVQAMLALLSTVGTDAGPSRPRQIASTRQEQVTDCINRHFSDPTLTVTAIADELKVSARYLQRVCESGLSPGEQLRQFRLRRSAERLRNPTWQNRSITDICFSCGFSSSSHFSTEFRRFFGVSPREYRALA
jgi:AraC-like DNA-binding protein